MAVEWTRSAGKHGIPQADAVHAMRNADVIVEIDGEPGDVTTLFIGHPHGQTDRYIEVIAAMRPPRTLVVFHVMPLSGLFRHLLEEGE